MDCNDCDDNDSSVNPAADELCGNAVDDDCNPSTADVFDSDGDGDLCSVDCNDANTAIGPSQTETTCNFIDDDCDPLSPDAPDTDGDFWSLCLGDCNDGDAAAESRPG